MSSHHVVREAQEPALLILHADYLLLPHISPLLEWSPFILTAADSLPEALEHQIKIDGVIFYKEQQKEISPLVAEQEPVALITLQEKETILSAALRHLARHGHSAVNILSSNYIPLKEELEIILSTTSVSLNVVLLGETSKAALCRAGRYVKWYPAAETIEVQPALKEMTISTTGFTENMQQSLLKGSQSLQTAATGVISIETDTPCWITEELY